MTIVNVVGSVGESQAINGWRAWVGVTRAPFLILTPLCVFLGSAVAWLAQGQVHWPTFGWVLLGALMAHIAVNALNEYEDFRSGLDSLTERTPFSGGSGTLPTAPRFARLALLTGIFALLLTVSIGSYLAIQRGALLWGWGVAGVLIIVTYTRWINKHPLLCLLAPGVGFGWLMVTGTEYSLTGQLSLQGALVALVAGMAASNLLLLNQIPDADADRQIGRHHIVIAAGKKFSARLFVGIQILMWLTILVGVLVRVLPVASLLTLLLAGLGWPIARGVLLHYDTVPRLIPSMGLNVLFTLSMPLILGISLLAATSL
ncbi:MAG: prenyltransferase [Hahellaceae bacterium]|nr:prenyltransferase [Hahellaceae bacterium]MCP5169188.1 prenyltransferase [Hahellaceae bacterium]